MPEGMAGSAAAVPGSGSGGGVGVAAAVGLDTSVGVEIASNGGRTAGVERGACTVVVPLHPISDNPMMAIRTRVRKEGLLIVVFSESWYARTVHVYGELVCPTTKTRSHPRIQTTRSRTVASYNLSNFVGFPQR